MTDDDEKRFTFQWFDQNGDPEGPAEEFTQAENAGRLPGYIKKALSRSDVKSVELILNNNRSMVWSKT